MSERYSFITTSVNRALEDLLHQVSTYVWVKSAGFTLNTNRKRHIFFVFRISLHIYFFYSEMFL